ncbi:hypothetical protein LTR59_018363, partial [Friedmanniomyces endolithicus]
PVNAHELDVRTRFGDIAIFGGGDAADDEVGDVGGEVQPEGRSDSRSDIWERELS